MSKIDFPVNVIYIDIKEEVGLFIRLYETGLHDGDDVLNVLHPRADAVILLKVDDGEQLVIAELLAVVVVNVHVAHGVGDGFIHRGRGADGIAGEFVIGDEDGAVLHMGCPPSNFLRSLYQIQC